MALIYPLRADAPEDDDAGFEEFADDLSDLWVVQVQVTDAEGAELETASFGPLAAEQAWDLGNDLDDAADGELVVELQPVFPYVTVDQVLEFMLPEEDED